MNMEYTTKAGSVGGSVTTVVPSAVVNLLKIKKGDKLVWNVNIDEKGVTVSVSPKKEEN
jgi:hypothetical protein